MLKEQAKIFNRIAFFLDIITVLIAFRLAYLVRSQFGQILEIKAYYWILVVLLPALFYCFSRYKLYSSLRTRSLADILVSLLKAHIICGVFVSATIYVFKLHGESRTFLFLLLLTSYTLITIQKMTVRMFLWSIRKRGYNFRNILIVGTGIKSQNFAKCILSNEYWGMRITGFLREPGDAPLESLFNLPVLAPIDELVAVCKKYPIDEVVFCFSKGNAEEIENYLVDMEELGITVRMTLDFFELRRSKREVSFFQDDIPVMTFYRKAFDADAMFCKRCMDVVGAIVGLLVTSMFSPFIALAIIADSPGPIFFGQNRVGEKGRIFTCWKFRSMSADAEGKKDQLLSLNEVKGSMFKMKNDPRVTKVGKFLRKTSLDELPQFWNVFKGEMSLVGTRPPTPDEVSRYENWHHRRICIKPGVTGLWQVSGRNQIQDFDEIVRLDLEYIDHWSLLFDLKIILRTFKVVFLREGSH